MRALIIPHSHPSHNEVAVVVVVVCVCVCVCVGGGGGVYLFHFVRPSVRPSVRPTCGVRSVTPTVLDGFFPYQAQIITSMWCVAHNELWPWPVSSRSLSDDYAIELLKYVTSCRVRSAAHTVWMDSFHVWYKWLLAWERVLHAMTFDFDLYLQGHSAMKLQ